MRLKLLPDDPEIGKSPYFWLFYLAFFIAPYCLERQGAYALAVAGAVLLVFLLLYFRSYRLQGAALWRNALLISSLGLIMVSVNPGASVFFTYSACVSAGFGRARDGALLIAINVLCGLLATAVFQLGWASVFFGVLFPAMVGGSALYGSQINRARSRLLRKQDEIEHLTKIAERERIARDMHDVLGHSLSVVVLKSELARRLIATDPERAGRELQDVEDCARQALAQVREAISGYRSAGWEAELEHARKVLGSAGVAFAFDGASVALPPACENVLALVLREAVTNIVRHASARHCRVALQVENAMAMCQINDDGVGLQSNPLGHGLRGMRERIEALHGTMHIDSAPGGVKLRFTLPLR